MIAKQKKNERFRLYYCYHDSSERIFSLARDASHAGMEECKKGNFDVAIQIYREVGVCYAKCRNLPLICVAYENIAKCAWMGKDYERCIMRTGSIIFMHSVAIADCFLFGPKVRDHNIARAFYDIVLCLYDDDAFYLFLRNKKKSLPLYTHLGNTQMGV